MTASHRRDPAPAGPESIGKFRLLTELGSGGMAEVYLALAHGPSKFAKLSVVKRLKRALVTEPDALAMFLSEAQLAARLNHPNVVQTFEVGRDGGEHYLVMEYLDGQSLDRLLRRAPADGPRTLPCVLRALCDALGGLHYAHELCDYDGAPLNVVHRDVNPRNVFVTYEGQTKVLDFGIAKALRASHVSRIGTLKGTVRYMAPEQVLGQPIDRRADIFAAGVILWELVAERRMWPGLDDIVILQRLMQGHIPELGEVKPDAPAELARVCARALAIEPADRYPSALHMRSELESAIAALGLEAAAGELGALVAATFRTEREELRRLIEQQFARATEGGALTSFASPPMSVGAPFAPTVLDDAAAFLGAPGAPSYADTPHAGPPHAGPPMGPPPASPPPHPHASPSPPPYPHAGYPSASTYPPAVPAAAPIYPPAGHSAPPPGSYTKNEELSLSSLKASRRRLAMRLAVPAGVVAIALVAFRTGRLGIDRAPPPSPLTEVSSSPAEAPSAPTSAPAPAPAPTTVELHVLSRPSRAQVYLDANLLGSTPLKVTLPRGGEHALRLEAPGHQALSQQVSLDHDITIELLLLRAPPAGHAQPPPPHPAGAKTESPDPIGTRLFEPAPPPKHTAPPLDRTSPYTNSP